MIDKLPDDLLFALSPDPDNPVSVAVHWPTLDWSREGKVCYYQDPLPDPDLEGFCLTLTYIYLFYHRNKKRARRQGVEGQPYTDGDGISMQGASFIFERQARGDRYDLCNPTSKKRETQRFDSALTGESRTRHRPMIPDHRQVSKPGDHLLHAPPVQQCP